MKRLVDTNVYVNVLLEKNIDLSSESLKLVNLFRSLNSYEVVLPVFILTEFSLLIQKVISKRQGFKQKDNIRLNKAGMMFIEKIMLKQELVSPSSLVISQAFKQFNRVQNKNFNQKDITFADLLLVEMAKDLDLVLVTGEKKLVKLCKVNSIKYNS